MSPLPKFLIDIVVMSLHFSFFNATSSSPNSHHGIHAMRRPTWLSEKMPRSEGSVLSW